ncbi:hypothetical protein BH23VER1_BH23VER1_20400 [soil metagenome]
MAGDLGQVEAGLHRLEPDLPLQLAADQEPGRRGQRRIQRYPVNGLAVETSPQHQRAPVLVKAEVGHRRLDTHESGRRLVGHVGSHRIAEYQGRAGAAADDILGDRFLEGERAHRPELDRLRLIHRVPSGRRLDPRHHLEDPRSGPRRERLGGLDDEEVGDRGLAVAVVGRAGCRLERLAPTLFPGDDQVATVVAVEVGGVARRRPDFATGLVGECEMRIRPVRHHRPVEAQLYRDPRRHGLGIPKPLVDFDQAEFRRGEIGAQARGRHHIGGAHRRLGGGHEHPAPRAQPGEGAIQRRVERHRPVGQSHPEQIRLDLRLVEPELQGR